MGIVPSPLRGAVTKPWSWAILSLAVIVSAWAFAPSADAAIRKWCRTDPIIAIDGELADIFVAAPLYAPFVVTGPNEVVVTVPVGVRAKLILNDLGFGRGTQTTIGESSDLHETDHGIEVLVNVRVPASDDDMPVRVEFAPRILGILWPETAEGTANEWITLQTVF